MGKIYTRKGDRGETGLLGPLRVPKDHPRIAAYGEVDELNAAIGAARAEADAEGTGTRAGLRSGRRASAAPRGIAAVLARVQQDLFVIGALLGTQPGAVVRGAPRIRRAHVGRLEREIDRATDRLPPLSTFILPGGIRLAAALHVARAVCRRAERATVALSRTEEVAPHVLAYLNRLSDLLFILARLANAASGRAETPWAPRRRPKR